MLSSRISNEGGAAIPMNGASGARRMKEKHAAETLFARLFHLEMFYIVVRGLNWGQFRYRSWGVLPADHDELELLVRGQGSNPQIGLGAHMAAVSSNTFKLLRYFKHNRCRWKWNLYDQLNLDACLVVPWRMWPTSSCNVNRDTSLLWHPKTGRSNHYSLTVIVRHPQLVFRLWPNLGVLLAIKSWRGSGGERIGPKLKAALGWGRPGCLTFFLSQFWAF